MRGAWDVVRVAHPQVTRKCPQWIYRVRFPLTAVPPQPEDRARQLAEVLRKKREEALAAAEAAQAEKEAARAAKEAAIAAARADAERKAQESRQASGWFSQVRGEEGKVALHAQRLR